MVFGDMRPRIRHRLPDVRLMVKISEKTQPVMMDVIKIEHEVDPLATQSNDNTDAQEKKPLPEEVDLLNLDLTEIKTECKDNAHDVISEIKVEEVGVSLTSPMVNCEAEGSTAVFVSLCCNI
ncbi:uncharacterized protein [Periplaneta americana]|uniref:uncharacterized protein isoform X4 n=1 Tax=Periplaneta americana TaxID=6978 RepID=UPI0037E933A5